MIMPRVEDNMSENTEVIISLHYKNLFFDTYSGPIRLVTTYILAKIERLLGRFHPDSFKTERLVCVDTDRRTDRGTDRRTWLDRLV